MSLSASRLIHSATKSSSLSPSYILSTYHRQFLSIFPFSISQRSTTFKFTRSNQIIQQKSQFMTQPCLQNLQQQPTMTDQRSLIQQKIVEQGVKIRELRAAKAEKAQLDTEVQLLQSLQAQLKQLNIADGIGEAKKFTLKTPKGTKDYTPEEMALREQIFSTIIKTFKRHGAVTIDTPVFELKEILAGKYGEDSKLIYDLQDQGGELCSLRYDLTVPFARYLACNGGSNQSIKRYHIAKVYRRDQPSVNKGRMREFYQCDFDIAGSYDAMIPDAEVLRIMYEVLSSLEIGSFTIKVNHRKLLDGMFEACGVPVDKFRSICSAVDKLDKMPWEEVKKEMVEQKGLEEIVADRIGEYVKLNGAAELAAKLETDPRLSQNPSALQGINDMKLLFKYLDLLGVKGVVSFDLSLARGLDYYTGVIYEAIFNPEEPKKEKGSKKKSSDDDTVGVGSIAGGGRYDELVGMFSGGKKIPCVGFSVGVERIFSILVKKRKIETMKSNECQVYVIAVGDGLLEDRMTLTKELWEADIKAEFSYKLKPKLQTQFNTCDREQIPFAVIMGPDELKEGLVKIKDMRKDREVSEEEKAGVVVKRSEIVEELKKRLAGM